MKCYSPEEVISTRLSKKDDNIAFENKNIFSNDQDRILPFLASVNEEKCNSVLDVCTNVLCDE